ncbi:MAG: hypothetical protein RMJ66_06515, partial [Bacteroidia bacterium]|nr:hypothetical protein [Bacteroidia bacterium]MDW8134705.1 hypothetical protein [Bacteroidia bacterium]
FKPATLLNPKAKGTLIVANKGEAPASTIRILLSYLDKEKRVKQTDTLEIALLKPNEEASFPLKAPIDGVKEVTAQILSYAP